MNDNDQSSSPVKLVITEADVVAFMQAKADELCQMTGGLFSAVKIEAKRHADFRGERGPSEHNFTSYVDGDTHRSASKLADAMQASFLAMDPLLRAAQLKQRAAELLAEAATLVPTPVIADKEGAAA
jgi:hypothetical protein